ncbi:MAG: ABC transporter ATP-binding protein NatA [Gemmatimonadaceae bacterium]|nr:ABC transporter ATP-binding protein NatA [Gemmatimonadaceae bacterium]
MTMSSAAVEVQGISRRFGRRWALRGISFAVMPGEVVGILGHNGSGKSTLLRVISTALRPTLGRGAVFGHDLLRSPDAVRGMVGFLAHSPGNYDDLTARENLRFAAVMSGLPVRDLDATLSRVGLASVADERTRGFSAGMQRRLALGRLLLCRPRLLLLDEPFNNFDAEGVALLHTVIEETRARGGSALVVLHDRRQAEDVLDRAIQLAQGALLSEEGARAPVRHAAWSA